MSHATAYSFVTEWNRWNLSRMNLKAGAGASVAEYDDDGEVSEV